jgi:hypothetical protein
MNIYVSKVNTFGHMPETREGGSLVEINSRIYLFGG